MKDNLISVSQTSSRNKKPPGGEGKICQTFGSIPPCNGIKPKGRVLRVKKGYNPNSSSIGSGILPFLAFAAGSGILTILLSNTLESTGKIIKKRTASKANEPLRGSPKKGI